MKAQAAQYPKPGPNGGNLIREVVGSLRTALAHAGDSRSLPITSHILIALSGGADSVALALLLKKYGRRAVDPKKIRAIHINHGWRGKESDADEAFVKALCKELKIPLKVVRLKAKPAQGESWEDAGRRARKAAFRAALGKTKAYVVTAHHADDLAETVLWRLLSGSAETHGGGIAWSHEGELRPLLKIRKTELVAFLKEEGQSWREDATNHEGRFLRSKLRGEVFPVLERIFPKAVQHLVQLGLGAQKPRGGKTGILPLASLRRNHWDALSQMGLRTAAGEWSLSLPEGWVFRLKRARVKAGRTRLMREAWVFERDKPLE